MDIDLLKRQAIEELEPQLMPARRFIETVKECIISGMDTIGTSTIADWMFVIPTMYGELRCLEADCLATADLIGGQIEFVKQDAITNKSGTITEARAKAATTTNDLLIKQSVAKYMARHVNALWSQLEMLIFSVRAMYDSRNQKVKNDV